MIKKLLFGLFIVLSFNGLAQVGWSGVEAIKADGFSTILDMRVVSDGYYLKIDAGTTVNFKNKNLNAKNDKYYLCKTDFSMNLIWSKELDIFTHMETDAAGNIYIGGMVSLFFESTDDTLFANGSYDGFVIKYSGASGKREWVKIYDKFGDEHVQSLSVDAQSNVYITGSYSNGNFLAKYSSAGDKIFEKLFKGITGDLKVLPKNGKIYLYGSYRDLTIGSTRYQIAGTDYHRQTLLALLNSIGEPEWVKTFKTQTELTYGVISAGTGGIYVAGMFGEKLNFTGEVSIDTTSLNDVGIYLAKFDDSGKALWQHNIGTEFQYFFQGGLATDAAENLYFSGGFEDELQISKKWKISAQGPGQENYLIILNSSGDKFTNGSFLSLFSVAPALTSYNNKVYLGGSFQYVAEFGSKTYDDDFQYLFVASPSLGTATGFAENSDNSDVTIFPNPVSEQIYINGKDVKDVEIYSINGNRVLMQDQVSGGAIDVTRLSEGLYILKFKTGELPIEKKISIVK